MALQSPPPRALQVLCMLRNIRLLIMVVVTLFNTSSNLTTQQFSLHDVEDQFMSKLSPAEDYLMATVLIATGKIR